MLLSKSLQKSHWADFGYRITKVGAPKSHFTAISAFDSEAAYLDICKVNLPPKVIKNRVSFLHLVCGKCTSTMRFHLFGDLPPETRLQIWESTLPGIRHVGPLIPEPRLNMRKRRGPYQEDPIALKINKESRHVALLHYTKRDALHLRYWEIRDDVKYCSYIDFKVDIAFFYDFSQFDLPTGPDDFIGSQFFSEMEMSRLERLWLVHDGILNLERDLAIWLDEWLPRFLGLKWMVLEVKGLKKCRGIAAPGGAFFTVEQALQDVREMGLEKLYRLQESLSERGIQWRLPVLEVENAENLCFERRLG